jgi:hypothetical protein
MKIDHYSQMIGHMTRDKTTDVPGSMAHGLRTGLYDGGRVGFADGTNLTNLEKKQNLYNKALNELPEGYLEDYKNIFLKERGDGTFSRKSGEEGGFDFMKEKYGNKLKQIKTRQGFTKNINEKIKVFNNAILQDLKKENKIVSGLKDKDAKRTKYVRDAQGRDIKYKAPKGYQAHHMLPLGSRIGMTNKDIAIISKEMNAALSEYDKPMNKLVEDSMKLNFNEEGSLKKLDKINKKLAGYVKKAEKELPKKYKGLIGFNKLTPVLDTFNEKGEQVFGVEKIGTDYKKSIGAKQTEKPLKDISTKELQKLTADAPKFSSNSFFDPSLMKKVISDLGKGINVGLGPSGILLLNSILGVDPTQSIDRAGLGLEAALAKPLVSGAVSVTDQVKNPMLRKIAERAALAGMSPAMAMKVASRLSPVGIASLAGEGLYQVGKLGYEDQQRFNALSPKEQAAERAQQEKFAFDIEGS